MSDKTRLETWLRKFRNIAHRKQVKCSNNQYWSAHNAMLEEPIASLSTAELAEELLNSPQSYPLTRSGKYQSDLIAEAIIDYAHVADTKRTKPIEVVGSASALFQASMNSTRDNDTPEDSIRKRELWGNKPDPEIRAKMTGGRANDVQVGGDHYKKQKIQHWDYVISNDIPYMEAQIIKYAGRWRNKNGLQDLEKALHFLQKLIEVEACTFALGAKPCVCHSGDVSAEQLSSTTCQSEKPSTSD